MSLPADGVYELRYRVVPSEPPELIGGVAATDLEGSGKPIGTAALVPSFYEKQKWTVRIISTEQKTCEILFGSSGGYGRGTWSYTSEAPGTPIILDPLPSTFSLESTGERDVYFIQPTGDMVGLIYMVGISDRGTLEIKGYPIRELPTRRPAWEFMRVTPSE